MVSSPENVYHKTFQPLHRISSIRTTSTISFLLLVVVSIAYAYQPPVGTLCLLPCGALGPFRHMKGQICEGYLALANLL